MPAITIINLCYNTGLLVVETLSSINSQTYKDFDVVIVDDASIDDSVSIVENWLISNAAFPYRIVKNARNLGIAASLNEGLKLATGKYISIIGDDIWHNNFLEKSIEVFNTAPSSVALVSSRAIQWDIVNKCECALTDSMAYARKIGYPRFDKLFEKIGTDKYILKQPLLNDSMFWLNSVTAFTVLIDKEKLKGVGGFCQDFAYEDYPSWFNLSYHYDFVLLDIVYGTYIKHNNNFSLTKAYLMNLETFRMLLSHYKNIKYSDTRVFVNNKMFSLFKNAYTHSDNVSRRIKLIWTALRLIKIDFKVGCRFNGKVLRYLLTR